MKSKNLAGHMTKTARITERCELLNEPNVDKLIAKLAEYQKRVGELENKLEDAKSLLELKELEVETLRNNCQTYQSLMQAQERCSLRTDLDRFKCQEIELESLRESMTELQLQNIQLKADLAVSKSVGDQDVFNSTVIHSVVASRVPQGEMEAKDALIAQLLEEKETQNQLIEMQKQLYGDRIAQLKIRLDQVQHNTFMNTFEE